MKILLDSRIAGRAAKQLPSGVVIPLPPDPRLAPPIASHPDMLFFCEEKWLLTDKAYYRQNEELLSAAIAGTDLHRHLIEEKRGDVYPYDIALNALRVGRYVFCYEKYTAPQIRALPYEIVDIRQGYAACSTLVLSDTCLVTADPSVEKAASKRNLDVVRIRPDGILLPGYDQGFIGGASSVIGNTVCFFGDPTTHPDFIRIEEACHACGYGMKAVLDGPLTDWGGAKCIP